MPRHPRANCYGYALGLDYNVGPGTRYGHDSAISDWSITQAKRVTDKHRRDLIAACEHDGLTKKSTQFGQNGVKIAVFIHIYENCIDYHFYRQEPDESWTHKLGANGVEQEVREPRSADSSLVDLGVGQGGSTIVRQAFVGFMWAPSPFPVTGDEWGDED